MRDSTDQGVVEHRSSDLGIRATRGGSRIGDPVRQDELRHQGAPHAARELKQDVNDRVVDPDLPDRSQRDRDRGVDVRARDAADALDDHQQNKRMHEPDHCKVGTAPAARRDEQHDCASNKENQSEGSNELGHVGSRCPVFQLTPPDVELGKKLRSGAESTN